VKAKPGRKDASHGRPRCVSWPVPAADQTCTLTRVVEHRGMRLEVWSCSDTRRMLLQVRTEAYRFPLRAARRWWPGCQSGWYDAIYDGHTNRVGWGDCTPGRTQFVVYRGGKPRKANP